VRLIKGVRVSENKVIRRAGRLTSVNEDTTERREWHLSAPKLHDVDVVVVVSQVGLDRHG